MIWLTLLISFVLVVRYGEDALPGTLVLFGMLAITIFGIKMGFTWIAVCGGLFLGAACVGGYREARNYYIRHRG